MAENEITINIPRESKKLAGHIISSDERHIFFNNLDGYATIFLTQEQMKQTSTVLGFIELLQEFTDKYGNREIRGVILSLVRKECDIIFQECPVKRCDTYDEDCGCEVKGLNK